MTPGNTAGAGSSLSRKMQWLLEDLQVLKVDLVTARRNRRTYLALQRRGLVRSAPWPEAQARGLAGSYWQITDAGAAVPKRERGAVSSQVVRPPTIEPPAATPAHRLEVREVLAGAYRGKALGSRTLLTHAVLVDRHTAVVTPLCRRVQVDALCDVPVSGQPTCPACATAAARLAAHPGAEQPCNRRGRGESR